jgi:hypothetical protein
VGAPLCHFAVSSSVSSLSVQHSRHPFTFLCSCRTRSWSPCPCKSRLCCRLNNDTVLGARATRMTSLIEFHLKPRVSNAASHLLTGLNVQPGAVTICLFRGKISLLPFELLLRRPTDRIGTLEVMRAGGKLGRVQARSEEMPPPKRNLPTWFVRQKGQLRSSTVTHDIMFLSAAICRAIYPRLING